MSLFALFLLLILGPFGQGLIFDPQLTNNDVVASPHHPRHALDHRPDGTPGKEGDNTIPLSQVLQHPGEYHQKVIRLRGTVTRLELHLDDTLHFIDFVFFLKDGEQRVLVFGRHDRTTGDIQLTSDRMVEVQGLFWQERFANGHRFENNLEAQHIRFYPTLLPDQA
jgi:hypothetical protein